MSSTNSTASNSTLNIYLENPLHQWAFLLFAILNTTVHSLLIVVTVHTGKLRASVNLLLAAESLSVGAAQVATGARMLMIICELPVSDNDSEKPMAMLAKTVYDVLGVSGQVAAYTAVALSLCIAVDRMSTVVAPFWFEIIKRRQWKVAGVYAVLAFAVGSLIELPIYFTKSQALFPFMLGIYYALCVGIFIAYLTLGLMLRWRTKKISYGDNDSDTSVSNPSKTITSAWSSSHSLSTSPHSSAITLNNTRRIFRALWVIAAIDELAWLVTPVCEQLLPVFLPGIDQNLVLVVSQYSYLVGVALQPGVLFCLSEEYREATNKTFQCFWHWTRKAILRNKEDPTALPPKTPTVVLTRNPVPPSHHRQNTKKF